MDRTAIRIVALLIGAAGIIVTVTKVTVPGTDLSFWDENLFITKQGIIESVHAWVFSLLALIGVFIELGSEIFDWPKEKRQKSTRFYFGTVVVIVAALVVVVTLFTTSANWLARQCWQPQIVAKMQEAYKDARFIVEHDGWRPKDIDNTATLSNPDRYRNANLESAKETLLRAETLLELPPDITDLPQRIARLDRYFGR
ncbi:MAG: hypothetical protein FJ246_09980 [Nitrospira sp.]|nr:hypothetical protein [Nitrospira sp.]